jgi:hypothetical protein
LALYAHTFFGTFIYDDTFQAVRDPRLADVRLWHKYLTEGYFPNAVDNLWRPLVSFSYAIQYQLHGPEPRWFHLVNVLLHAAASAAVGEFARRMTSNKVALLAGLLFAAHPVHVEAVAYIVGRAESACLLGILGALILATKSLTTARVWAITACTFAAIFSKEQGLLAAPMVFALLWWRRSQGQWSPDERKPARLLAAVLTLALSAYITYRNRVLPWYWETTLLDYAIQPMVKSALLDRLLIPFALLGRYATLIIAPIKLSPDYGLAVLTHHQDWHDPYLWIGFAVVIAATLTTIRALRRRDPTTVVLLVCTALTYLMVSNVTLIGTILGERLIYIPSAFLLILAARAIARLPTRMLTPAVALILAIYSLRTITYAAQWHDRLSFYESALAQNPRAIRLHVILSRELLAKGDLHRARSVIDHGLSISGEDWRLWVAAAQVAIAQRRLDDAKHDIDQAWMKDPFVGDMLYLERLLNEAKAATQPNR